MPVSSSLGSASIATARSIQAKLGISVQAGMPYTESLLEPAAIREL